MEKLQEGTPCPSILLVDDEETIRRLMKAVLAETGYRILQAASSDEALGVLETPGHGVQLVVTDIQMPPGMDGLSLVETVRRRYPNLPVLFISGYSHFYSRLSEILETGRTWFLQKPFSPNQLVEAVKHAI
jgi:two-component system cell cycle sensor histidine kinase/response regulator CckA